MTDETRKAVQAELERQREHVVHLESALARTKGNVAELELALQLETGEVQ